MSETTQPQNWPNPRGPWHEVTDTSRTFDHGRYWCANTAGHPNHEHGYPDPNRHVPWNECRTLATSFDGVRLDLTGTARALELYAAAPFQFGEPRGTATVNPQARVVLEWYSDGPDAEPAHTVRVSIPIGEALRLARRIGQVVDAVTVPPLQT